MKKFFITFLMIALSLAYTKAQFVTIPDAHFVTWLKANGYAACMNGSQLDTTCTTVVNATTMVCNNAQIGNLSGLQYFDNLSSLNCEHNNLTGLPKLPATLNFLFCSNNALTSLPTLPTGLLELECNVNALATLPALPNSLNDLLDCSSNNLITLPALPTSLLTLYCNNNQLGSLPALPGGLQTLDCSTNALVTLPALPKGLFIFRCNNNQLTGMPSLPKTIFEFNCSDNLSLSCLSHLPDTLNNFYFGNTNLACIPNKPTVLGTVDPPLELTAVCACQAPAFTVNKITNTNATVAWTNAQVCFSANLFQIQYRVTGAATWTLRTAYSSASFKIITDLTPATKYDVRMRTNCSTSKANYSDWSDIQNFTTTHACLAPAGIAASNLKSTRATISWSAALGAYSYKLRTRVKGTTAWTNRIILAPATAKVLTGLSVNTAYEYQLQTICDVSGTPSSGFSAIQNFSTTLRMEGDVKEEVSDLLLYPNPTSLQLTVSSEQLAGGQLLVTDILGRNYVDEKITTEGNATILDVSQLTPGVYFVILRSANGNAVKKFVKE